MTGNPPRVTPREMTYLIDHQRETLAEHARFLHEQMDAASGLLEMATVQRGSKPPEPDVGLSRIRLRRLPQPDRIAIDPSQAHPCLILDGGVDAAPFLVAAIERLGLPVTCLPSDVLTEGSVAEHIPSRIAGFIYLHARVTLAAPLAISDSERERLKALYLSLRHVADALQTSPGRPFLMTVSWLDGLLGTTPEAETSPLGGGLFGLLKSLNREWPHVFCRAVDCSPVIGPGEVADRLVAELQDPDTRLVDVGLHPDGRYTLCMESGD